MLGPRFLLPEETCSPRFLDLLLSCPMDQISMKTPNPKCHLYWFLMEFIDMRYSQSCCYFRPLLWTSAPLTSLVRLPPPLPPFPVWICAGVCTKYVRIYKEYKSVCPIIGIGLSQPLCRQRVCPSRLPPEPGGGGHTHQRVRGWGSPNSDDWRKSLALCLLCV